MASGRVRIYLDDGIKSIQYASVDADGVRNPTSGYNTATSNLTLSGMDHVYIASCTLESGYEFPWEATYSGSFEDSSVLRDSGTTSTVNVNIYPQDGLAATMRLSATAEEAEQYTYTFKNNSDYALYLKFSLGTSSTTSLTIAAGGSKTITCAPGDMEFDPDACKVDGKTGHADCIYWQRTSPTTGSKYCLDDTDGAYISLRSAGAATYTFTVSGYTPPVTYYTVTFRHYRGSSLYETTYEDFQANTLITLSNYAESYSGYAYSYATNSSGATITNLTVSANTTVYLYYVVSTVTITFRHYRGGALYTTTSAAVNYGSTVTVSGYKVSTIPNCVYDGASVSSFTATANRTVDLYYIFKWTYAKTKGAEFNLTATEWNNLIDFVNDQRSSDYSFTKAVKGNTFTAAMYNQMVSAIGAGTTVSKGQVITAALMNALVTNANNM